MSSRITRSAAKLAAENTSTNPPAAPAVASTPQIPQSRKRKATQRLSNPESPLDPVTAGSARRSKRRKVEEVEEPEPPPRRSAPRSRQNKGKQPNMSSPSAPNQPSNNDDPPTIQTTSSSRRKSTRNKKQAQEPSPPTTGQPFARRPKKSKKTTLEDVIMQEDEEEVPKPTGSKGGIKEHPDTSDEEEPISRDQDDQDDEDDDVDDPFRSGLYGRAEPATFSLRALTGMMSGSGTASRLREILEQLRRKDDPSAQLIALGDLSQLLLVSNEDNLSGHFAPDLFVKELVKLMQPNDFGEENPEMMLLACRCIANLMEALPPATSSVVYGGAVPILCQKLLEIHYIDLAEQALSTLEKISVEYPAFIVREGGLTACLSYLDFFPTSTQRSAVVTAANCCRDIPEASIGVVRDVMPILLNVLGGSDQRVVEQGSLCVSRIVESFKDKPSMLEELVSPDLLRTILRLLLPGSTNLISPNIHTQFLKVLGHTARASPILSAELLKMDVVDTLYQILTGVSPPEDTEDLASKIDGIIIMQALIHRPRDQVFETLHVICELLPGISSHSKSMDDGLLDAVYPGGDADSSAIARSVKKPSNAKRVELLGKIEDKVKRFATILLPTLTHAYSSTVNLSVRQNVLTAQLKMLSNLDEAILENALRSVPFASYLASILSQQDDPSLVRAALQAAELLLERLKPIYGYQFYREGVMDEITKLANRPLRPLSDKGKGPRDSQESAQRPVLEATGDRTANITNPEAVARDEEDGDDDDIDEDDDDDEDDNDGEDDDDDDDERVEIHEDISPSPSSSSVSGAFYNRLNDVHSFEDYLTLRAKHLIEIHQDKDSLRMHDKARAILNQAQDLASNIIDCYSGAQHQDGAILFHTLAQHFGEDALDSITSAELLSSGVIDTLLEVLADGEEQSKIKAKSAFLEAFMGTDQLRPGSKNQHSSAFSVLVHKLQDLLSRAEHFEVVTVHHNSHDSNRTSAASMLAKQLRLKLVADEDSDIPKTYRNIMVSIHAIATFKALDDYLRPRITILSDRPRMGRRGDGLSSTLAAFAAATGMPQAQQNLMARDLLDMPHSPLLPAPGNHQSSAKPPRKSTGRDKKPFSQPGPAPQTPTTTENKPPSRRSLRRAQASTHQTPAPPPPETPVRSQDPLECADEHQLSDDEMDDQNALDAFVDDLEDEMDDHPLPDPSAVSLEVAPTGKITARQEDGTRVPTPHNAGSVGLPHPSRARSGAPSSAAARAMSYAAAIQSVPQDWHIEFSIDDQVVSNETTIYRAVHYNKDHPQEPAARNVWSGVHPIKFRKVSGPPPAEPVTLTPPPEVPGISNSTLPVSLHKHTTTSKILRLLNALHTLNANLDDVLDEKSTTIGIKPELVSQFVNTKLTAKLNRQLEEPLVVASNCLPSWSEDLARLYPFLFPFESRHLFLQSTSFGYSRSMTRWQNAQTVEDTRRDRHRDDRPFLGRLQRQKVRISRSRILESAVKVMELYGASPSVLEVEYFDEVGTGLGPTLEFYSTVSKEFSKKKIKLWRENESIVGEDYAFGVSGLFPAPMSAAQAESENGSKILHLFKMLGKFVARAMLDSRIIDVSFNPTFFKLGDERSLTSPSLAVLRTVDADLANSLQTPKTFIALKKEVEANTKLSKAEKAEQIRNIEVKGSTVEGMGLDFTLPGYDSIELVEGGSNIPLTTDNIELYVQKVLDFTLGSGVQRQIQAFRAGFSQVFPYSALKSFTPSELVMLFGRVEEDWSIETLMDSIKADHGFNMDSRSVRNLLQTMSEFTPALRRDFLQFVTGSPKLPIGGFKSLTPMFTVVCRPSEPPYTSDDYLPSVMTCVNYLKLPDYSDLDIMRTQLHTAIKEGQGAFHLS